jgi:tripartite-type tricarboxylate transporter receptor subunit TctC
VETDLVPVMMVGKAPYVVATSVKKPFKTFADVIAAARTTPVSYGTSGPGSSGHLAMVMLARKAGVPLDHVPYKGVGEAITDLMAGRIDVCIGSATALLPLVKSGKLRALAITGKTRWAMMPDVPTVDEAGVKGFVYTPWYGLWYPAGTPTEYVTRMRQEVVKALEDPEVKRSFAEQGYVTVGSTPAEFAKVITDEIEANKRLATKINFAQ